MEYQKTLMQMIERLIDGEWSVADFERHYYDYFLETVPDQALTTDELEFFASIQQKLDWTADQVDSESAKYDWITQEEYVDWVRGKYQEFLKK